ncbi:MAG: discoidin domain-containing protein [Bacteroidales bacterium]|nr:discoidin domain-containing protein [Bacteroidales bacterium]
MKRTIVIISKILLIGIFCHNLYSINLSIDYKIIPQSKDIVYSKNKSYILDYTSYISFSENNPELENCAVLLQEYIDQSCGLYIEAYPSDVTFPEERSIYLSIDNQLANGSFKFSIAPEHILIVGSDYNSIVSGVQYFRKLISSQSNLYQNDTQLISINSINNASIKKSSNSPKADFPSAEVHYIPNIENRAFILQNFAPEVDEAYVLKLLDVLSLHGFNVLCCSSTLSNKVYNQAALLGIKILNSPNYISNVVDLKLPISDLFNISDIVDGVIFNYDANNSNLSQILPKLAAIEEIQWSTKADINFVDFCKRLEKIISVYNLNKYSYSDDVFNIQNEVAIDSTNKNTTISLFTYDENPIILSINDEIMHYNEPIILSKSSDISAITARKGIKAKEINFDFDINKATYSCVKCDSTIFSNNIKPNLQNLIDGLKSSSKKSLNQWVEFNADTIEINIDLPETKKISKLSLNSIIDHYNSTSIKKIRILASSNGNNYSEIDLQKVRSPKVNEDGIALYTVKFKSQEARFVKLIIYPQQSNGCNKILIDEIILN